MITAEYLLWGLGLPFAVAMLVVGLLGGWRWGVAVGLAAAYAAGHIAIAGWPGAGAAAEAQGMVESIKAMQPTEARDWALVFAGAAGLVGLLISCSCVSAGAVWLARLLLGFAVVNAVLWTMIDTRWDKVQALVYVQSIIGIVLVIWWSLDGLAERARGATVPLVLCLTAGAAAALIMLNDSESLGKLAAVLSVTLLATFVVGLFRKSLDLSRGGMAVIMTITAALLLSAVFYGEVPMWAALTVALAPILAWVRLSRAFSSMKPASAALVTAILVLIPLLVAVTPSAIALYRGGEGSASP